MHVMLGIWGSNIKSYSVWQWVCARVFARCTSESNLIAEVFDTFCVSFDLTAVLVLLFLVVRSTPTVLGVVCCSLEVK
jgi:hypothetical protein